VTDTVVATDTTIGPAVTASEGKPVQLPRLELWLSRTKTVQPFRGSAKAFPGKKRNCLAWCPIPFQVTLRATS